MAFVFFASSPAPCLRFEHAQDRRSSLPGGGGRAARAACWRLASLPWFLDVKERGKVSGEKSEKARKKRRVGEARNDGCEGGEESEKNQCLFTFFFCLFLQRIRARERALSLFFVLSLAPMKKRKQQHEQVLAANGTTSGGGGSQKGKGNGFVVGGGGSGRGSDTPPSGVGNGTSTAHQAPSPNRLARFQSERASLPIWLARKQLLAEVIEGDGDAFFWSSFCFFVFFTRLTTPLPRSKQKTTTPPSPPFSFAPTTPSSSSERPGQGNPRSSRS